MNRKVELPGHGIYWFLDDHEDGIGPLAQLEHCELRLDSVFLGSESYSYVFEGGVIKRHNQVIGSVSDFKDVPI